LRGSGFINFSNLLRDLRYFYNNLLLHATPRYAAREMAMLVDVSAVLRYLGAK